MKIELTIKDNNINKNNIKWIYKIIIMIIILKALLRINKFQIEM